MQVSLTHVAKRGSYRRNRAGERAVIYYPGGPQWAYNNAPIPTKTVPEEETKKTYQTYDLRGLKQYDDSNEDKKKYSDYHRYETRETPNYFQQQRITSPGVLREYKVTDSLRRKPQQLHQQKFKQPIQQQQHEKHDYQQHQQQSNHKQQQEETEPTFLLISPKDNEWTKADREWLKKTESLWDKSDEWSPSQASQWKENSKVNWNKQLESNWYKQSPDWEHRPSEGKTYQQSDDRSLEHFDYTRRRNFRPKPDPRYEDPTRRGEAEEMNVYGKQGYLIAQQPRTSGRRLVSRYKGEFFFLSYLFYLFVFVFFF